MEQKEIFRQGLGFGNDWEVRDIDFNKDKQELRLRVAYIRTDALPPCPECGAKGVHIHDYRPHRWRHLNFWQHTTHIEADVPRVRCDNGHVRVLEVNWARKGSGYTLLLEAMVLELAKGMPVAQVSRIVGLADTKLWRIIDWYVEKALNRQDLSKVRRVGLDETSRRRRHKYISIFMDLDTRQVLFITKGKGKEVIAAFARHLRNHGGDPAAITNVTCDMSKSFLSGVPEHLPNAKITLDRFHIIKLVNEALNETRRRERSMQPCLKGLRFSILKNPNNLSASEQKLIDDLEERNIETARAYHLRILFDDFFRQTKYEAARGFLKAWVIKATQSKIPEMEHVAATIREHWKLIVNWTNTRISNGLLEGFNSLLQAMKSCARGYRTVDYITNIGYLIGLKPREGFHHR